MDTSQFTKYEIARIIGTRALQIAMDAPLLLKISQEELESIKYDPIRISEKEFEEGVLPISINRPIPRKGRDKLRSVKEENISDEEIIAKEKEVEKEIKKNPSEYSLVQDDDEEKTGEVASSEEQ